MTVIMRAILGIVNIVNAKDKKTQVSVPLYGS